MHATLTERWNSISLRTKITGVTVLMLTLGILVSGLGTMAMLKPFLIAQVDARLTTVAHSENLTTYFTKSDDGSFTIRPGNYDYYVLISDVEGNGLYHNWSSKPDERPVVPDSLSLNALAVTLRGNEVFQLYDASHRTEFRAITTIVTLDSRGSMGTALIAASLQQTNTILVTYLGIFFGFGLGVVLLGGVLTHLLVTSAFGPLRQVDDMAAKFAAGNFDERLSGETPNTEVGRLNHSLNRMLDRIDQALGDRADTIRQMRRFVGDASHELRTPLVSVRGYAELYRMGALSSDDEVGQAMDRIEKEAIRMAALVEDLLELARLDENTRPLDLARIDLFPLADDAARDTMASSPQRTVTVITAAPPDLESGVGDQGGVSAPPTPSAEPDARPAAPATGPIAFAGAQLAKLRQRRGRRTGPVPRLDEASPAQTPSAPQQDGEAAIVFAEENKIRQVIINLLGNAMRFTPEDSPLEIRVYGSHRQGLAYLEIIDHGEGIPPQIREKIFQRFWRADTSRARETGGSGLGLAIVASIVHAHSGDVTVFETPGGGATFRITLPLAEAIVPQSEQPGGDGTDSSPTD